MTSECLEYLIYRYSKRLLKGKPEIMPGKTRNVFIEIFFDLYVFEGPIRVVGGKDSACVLHTLYVLYASP